MQCEKLPPLHVSAALLSVLRCLSVRNIELLLQISLLRVPVTLGLARLTPGQRILDRSAI